LYKIQVDDEFEKLSIDCLHRRNRTLTIPKFPATKRHNIGRERTGGNAERLVSSSGKALLRNN